MNKILITGSSGGIGGALTEYLSLKSMEKKSASKESDVSHSVTFNVVGNYDKREHWEGALKGVDTVIHLAALAHTEHVTSKDFFETNVEITKKLYELCIVHNVKHFIFISSVTALTESSAVPLHEEVEAQPISEYGKSKHEGEEILKKLSKNEGAPLLTILRSPTVFGEGCSGGIEQLIKICLKLPILPFGACVNQRSFLSLVTFLKAIEQVILNDNCSGLRVYHVSDHGSLSVREISEIISAEFLLGKKSIFIPESLFKVFSFLGNKTGVLSMSQLKVRQLFSPLLVSGEKFQKDFPEFSPSDVKDKFVEYLTKFNKFELQK